ncbi:hypothetical protein Ae168Ps1_2171c [Pseudonocardia sp. Ae168_Ps1]|jgi:hypothetical protein|uniref:hypothetical protein n=1 Tax=unclassified Pseudonocardia TaxID=2619320 RepID=UPI0001FFDF36|nr:MULTISPECIES: hypothetical protein [unclassified Pseudonocardia]ALE72423.1 hypothetical protein FRP1_03510 [Pseudonocardia sp. EC080625-04]ALL75721.1 hypothetical protein AD006_11120 [Pseudonocardia sp. EC080610-09]OLL73784.1 hypothetical protein Ae150APs1_2162c [Pseudonocardia sp. Ae150A_Ps1]OLL79765.1 hypothetical protein Ae168Ps1_2171c [Pseudonocardia sp. Ae168_Ps1]OLL86101.1 hypothetical protein Ae263Ps1_3156 [Pseudonocardia sp. Ae263_Ps1]
MDLIDYLGCVALSGACGAVAGWTTVRRMLRPRTPPRGTVMRDWPGRGHFVPPVGRPRRRRRRRDR